jgi:hypothetical protein
MTFEKSKKNAIEMPGREIFNLFLSYKIVVRENEESIHSLREETCEAVSLNVPMVSRNGTSLWGWKESLDVGMEDGLTKKEPRYFARFRGIRFRGA